MNGLYVNYDIITISFNEYCWGEPRDKSKDVIKRSLMIFLKN